MKVSFFFLVESQDVRHGASGIIQNYSAARLSKVLVSLNMLFQSFNMFGSLRDENVRFPIQT